MDQIISNEVGQTMKFKSNFDFFQRVKVSKEARKIEFDEEEEEIYQKGLLPSTKKPKTEEEASKNIYKKHLSCFCF